MTLFTTEATSASAVSGDRLSCPSRQALKVRIGFRTQWLRETTNSVVDSEFNAVFDSGFDAAVEVESAPRIQVRPRASGPLPGGVDDLLLFLLGIKTRSAEIRRACNSWDSFQQLGPDERRELKTVFGRIKSPGDYAGVMDHVAAFIELRDRILRASLAALEWKCCGLLAAQPERELPSQVWLQLQLPTMDRPSWTDRLSVLPDCVVEAGAADTVVLRPLNGRPAAEYNLHYQTALALGANWAPPETTSGFHLAFADERTLDRDHLDVLLQPMLETYGFSGPDRETARSLPANWRRVNVQISLRVAGQAARAWLQTPKERSKPFNELFGDVSSAVQRLLRTWIPYIRFSRNALASARDESYALLAYRASRIFSRRSRPEFTYDAMNRASVRQACLYTRTALAEALAQARKFLLALGQDEEADWYDSDKLDWIIRRVQTGNKTFLSLLSADSFSVERFRKLSAWCRQLHLSRSANPEAPAEHLLRAAREVNRVFRIRFNRLSTEDDMPNLGNLLMVEASAAASEHFGRPAPIEMSVRLGNADAEGGGQFVLQNTVRIGPGGVGIINALP